MLLDTQDASLMVLVHRYVALLDLPTDRLRVTTSRAVYAQWIRRRVPSAYGGAYCFVRGRGLHAVLVNMARIDQEKPFAVEVVVAEELLHMRDHLDGDTRRHAHHGYDRIALRVAELTGVSLEEIRSALIPPNRRPVRYVYQCPRCQVRIGRRKRGTWSCGRCASRFDPRLVLHLVDG